MFYKNFRSLFYSFAALPLLALSIANAEVSYDNSFKDMEYIIDKQKVRYTIEHLEKLKKLFPENSKDYEILEQTENHFLKKLPIDAFGTYTRIKVHNIIDNKLEEGHKKQTEFKILKADTDLQQLVYQKELLKKQKLKNSRNTNKNTISKKQNIFTEEAFFKNMEKLRQMKGK